MGQMKTPGVYVVEKNAFPNSVVEVATAVPAFIGYTKQALNGGKSLKNVPWRIASLGEFIQYFGGGPNPEFSLKKADDGSGNYMLGNDSYVLEQVKEHYLLYYSIRLFYQNGGGPCYIVSVGNYQDAIEPDPLKSGIDELIKYQEPTMVVIPDAVLLKEDDCIGVQQAMLAHCGAKMRSRISILDIYNGYLDRRHESGDCVENFRNKLGINFLDFASVYYPWVNTTIVQDNELSYQTFDEDSKAVLKDILLEELVNPYVVDGVANPKLDALSKEIEKVTDSSLTPVDRDLLNKVLIQLSPKFNALLTEVKEQLNCLPPSGAMAGVYTMVDKSRGVWKAPANVSLNAVVSPTVNITHDDQEDLNIPIQGKAVNAIRSFIGEGVLVWGSRTLDGNSQDWRYINVRRTMIMLEESIRLASKAYVFENNTANTWVTMKSMIGNFLTGIWKRGGLAGASPEDAFSVHVGLGETMTPNDILDGILRITVLVALIRPAEFIEITFQQQMQKS